MSVYLYGFGISIALIALSEKISKKQRWFFALIALLIPCLIAGYRASSIGVDTEGYLVPMTNAAIFSNSYTNYISSSWFRIWRYLSVRDYEVGFSLVVFVAAKIFKSVVAVQFIIQALTVFPIYIAANRTKYKTWICMAVYYFMFFNKSLNMIRQMVAMAFVLLAIQLLSEGKVKWFITLSLVGFTFHYSAIISFLIAVIYFYVQSNSSKESTLSVKSYKNAIVVITIGILGVVGSSVVAGILPYIGLGRYVNYLVSISGGIHFLPMQIIIRLPLICLFILNWKSMNLGERNSSFYVTMIALDAIVAQLASVTSYSGRIALYFSVFNIYSYASVCSNTKHKFLVKLITISYLILYWWYYYVFLGTEATVPYMSLQ